MIKAESTSQEKLSSRGELILNSAQKLFFQYGFDKTSLEMIINEAGGSRRSIYKDFGNKKGLLIAVIKRQVSVQSQILTTINRDLEPKEALQKVCFKFVQGMQSPAVMSLFRLVIQQAVKLPELGEIIYQKGPLAGIFPLVEYLDFLTEKKVIQVENTYLAAQMLIEMAKGPLHTRTLLIPDHVATDDEISEQVGFAVDMFLNAYSINKQQLKGSSEK
jgi:TetR/AcrR family transcriptional repressor of mexJK operon